MKVPGLGCCCGVIVGIVLTVFILCAAAFGVYCYFNPEARNSAVNVVEKKWDKVMNWVWYVMLGLFGAAFIYLVIRRFF